MGPLELKKLQVELLRVSAAKGEMELKIDERMDEVRRLEEHIKVQTLKEEELRLKITEMQQQ